jgi:hypothetical protein
MLRLAEGPDQYLRTGLANRLDPNVDFAENLTEDPDEAAPHRTDAAGRELSDSGRAWDLLRAARPLVLASAASLSADSFTRTRLPDRTKLVACHASDADARATPMIATINETMLSVVGEDPDIGQLSRPDVRIRDQPSLRKCLTCRVSGDA